MRVVEARNVNDAYQQGLELLLREGQRLPSRAGEVLVAPYPVMTVYEKPQERVLLHPGRDANPFFTLMEAMWMLAGRNDATWLDQFIHDYSQRFAEPDGRQHGAYGFRWRHHFDMEGGGSSPDQLRTVEQLLRYNPDDRRVVLTMWDPVADLGRDVRDVPCNTHIYFRIRDYKVPVLAGHARDNQGPGFDADAGSYLDMTVCCRSNDAVWGAYYANAVHFSFLQEYLATRLGVQVGRFFTLSNNFHVYTSVLGSLGDLYEKRVDPYAADMVFTSPFDASQPSLMGFEKDLRAFMEFTDLRDEAQPLAYAEFGSPTVGRVHNPFLRLVAMPMYMANRYRRQKKWDEALAVVQTIPSSWDWRVAAEAWLNRRVVRVREKANG